MECTKCGTEMKEGYTFKANNYGTIKIEQMPTKRNMPKVSVCPKCGHVEIFVDVNHIR